jgi:hypothetical protein
LRQRRQTNSAPDGKDGSASNKEVDQNDPIFWFGLPSPHLKTAQKDFQTGAHVLLIKHVHKTYTYRHFLLLLVLRFKAALNAVELANALARIKSTEAAFKALAAKHGIKTGALKAAKGRSKA